VQAQSHNEAALRTPSKTLNERINALGSRPFNP
jgi:hypothetical protein